MRSLQKIEKYEVVNIATAGQALGKPLIRDLVAKMEDGQKFVVQKIALSLKKTLVLLGYKMDDGNVSIFAESIAEQYRYESLELILLVLKKCRDKNTYKEKRSYHKEFNLHLFDSWMSEELERIAQAREQRHMELSSELEKRDEEKNKGEIARKWSKKVLESIKDKHPERLPTLKNPIYIKALKENIHTYTEAQIERLKARAKDAGDEGVEVLEIIKNKT